MINFEYYKTNIKSKEAYEKMVEKIKGSATIPSFTNWLNEEHDEKKKVHSYLFSYSVKDAGGFGSKWGAFPCKSYDFTKALYKFMQFIDKYETANKDKLRIVEIKEDDKVLLDEDGTYDRAYLIICRLGGKNCTWDLCRKEQMTFNEAREFIGGKLNEINREVNIEFKIVKVVDNEIYTNIKKSEEKDTKKQRHYKFGYTVFDNKEHTLGHTNYFECWDTDFVKAMDRFVNWMQNRCTFGYSYDIAWEDGVEIFNRAESEKREYLKLKKKYYGDDDVNRYADLKKKYGYLDKENN